MNINLKFFIFNHCETSLHAISNILQFLEIWQHYLPVSFLAGIVEVFMSFFVVEKPPSVVLMVDVDLVTGGKFDDVYLGVVVLEDVGRLVEEDSNFVDFVGNFVDVDEVVLAVVVFCVVNIAGFVVVIGVVVVVSFIVEAICVVVKCPEVKRLWLH